MALSNGDTVLPVAPTGDLFQHGDDYPVFGTVVDATGGAAIVAWRNGNTTSGIAAGTTMDVLAVPASPTIPVGAYVRITSEENPNQQLEGRVVAAYTRDNDGAGSPSAEKIVIRNRDGLYYEATATDAEIVKSR